MLENQVAALGYPLRRKSSSQIVGIDRHRYDPVASQGVEQMHVAHVIELALRHRTSGVRRRGDIAKTVIAVLDNEDRVGSRRHWRVRSRGSRGVTDHRAQVDIARARGTAFEGGNGIRQK